QVDAVLVGEALDGLPEAEAVDLHQEGEDVPALLAAETVKEAPARCDVEGRRLLVVEGTQPLHRAPACVAQRHVARHDVVDPGPLTDRGDVLVTNPASHGRDPTDASANLSDPSTGPRCERSQISARVTVTSTPPVSFVHREQHTS